MSNKDYEWILATILLNTMELGYVLYRVFVQSVDSFSSIFIPLIPVFIFNVVTFIYFSRKRKDFVVNDSKG